MRAWKFAELGESLRSVRNASTIRVFKKVSRRHRDGHTPMSGAGILAL